MTLKLPSVSTTIASISSRLPALRASRCPDLLWSEAEIPDGRVQHLPAMEDEGRLVVDEIMEPTRSG
jgi:hypothetical protein